MTLMKRIISIALLFVAFAGAAFADKPAAADVLKDAQAKASQEHKRILVFFDASW
jgi:hypothetical protein